MTTTTKSTSDRMRAVRREGTSAELRLRGLLWGDGIRGYRLCDASLPGKPDLVFTRWRIAVFVDGAFWHGHPSKFLEANMSPYWRKKIDRNRQRDKLVTSELRNAGWNVIRLWDFEIQRSPVKAVKRIVRALERARSGQ